MVKQVKYFKGIGCFLDGFVEQADKFDMKDDERTANMADRKHHYTSHSSLEGVLQNSEVIAQKEVASRKSKCNMKRRRGLERKDTRQTLKEEARTLCINSVVLTPNPIEDYKTKLRNNAA